MNGHHIPVVVVVTLALVVLGGLAFIGFLATTGTAIPDQLDRLVSTALGALGAILATTRGGTDATPVVVENRGREEAIPVEPTGD